MDVSQLVLCGLSLMLVLVLAPRVFLRVLWFSSLHEHSKFQFDKDIGPVWKPAKADVASSLNIVIFFIYLLVSTWLGRQTVKNLRQLKCKFGLAQSKRNSSPVNTSASRAKPNKVPSALAKYICNSVWPGLYSEVFFSVMNNNIHEKYSILIGKSSAVQVSQRCKKV